MISILVDECYAFDYLSILQVKKNLDQANHTKPWKDCFDHLKEQLGNDKFTEIIQSLEYNNLYKSNLFTFDAVSKARSGGNISAKEVDDCNMGRYDCKIKLQKAFFPESELMEKKL